MNQEELEKTKEERDAKIIEMQKNMDKERENFKNKLKEAEGRGNIGSAKHTEMLLNFEREKAAWQQEKSYLQH